MKKLIIAAILMTTMGSFAQEQKTLARKEKMEQLTPAQRNELRLKKMTLELGLNATQQKEMGSIIAEQSTKHEAAKAERQKKVEVGQKPTSDEKYAMKTKMLDEQIATKERVKKILTPEQFEKWEKMKQKRHHGKNGEGKKHRMKPEEKK
jgi:hypothetical protein